MACCLVLAEDTTVASRTGRIVFAQLDKKVKEDLENDVIRVGSDETVLQYQKDMACCLVLAEDTTVASRTGRIVFAQLDKKVKEGSILMTEPNIPDDKVSRGILVAKELVKA
ncbi:hypothetical protein QE152_g8489 [Popillia japonica]|uniref:Uncharacterized protein n=1 Tax=Popillia japonica TaxID=7064 RepID=A0AAW1MAJ5_POPJA